MAHFDRSILPGREGKIILRLNTSRFRGSISKTARVYTNDPHHKIASLSIKAFVKVSIYISSRYIYLKGMPEEIVKRTVTLRAEEKRPLQLETIHFNLNNKVSYRIEEVEPGRLFLIHFTNIPGPTEIFHGILKLKTNYPEKPEINISIRGKFQKGVKGISTGKKKDLKSLHMR
ncbi:MAG: hypothetical protein SV375_12055 [Thermodesulfobacteriota bacterium]|nr:hypothetical protein [Thermodesulfobacteriota bacterium]